MNKAQALKILEEVTGMVSLNRKDHELVLAALHFLRELPEKPVEVVPTEEKTN